MITSYHPHRGAPVCVELHHDLWWTVTERFGSCVRRARYLRGSRAAVAYERAIDNASAVRDELQPPVDADLESPSVPSTKEPTDHA